MRPVFLPSTPDDSRDYALYRHASGLTCLLVSDPAASQATAVMRVRVGSNDEPETWPGLAHLLEHMMFMGCRAHPEAGSFARSVDRWGGRYNASTAPDETGFFFSVAAAGLESCLMHLVAMLGAPLFDPCLVESERRVLDAEFRTRLGDDALHEQAALAKTFDPRHPKSRFTAGNADTLAGEPEALTQALRDFHQRYYRANATVMVLHGPADPDSLRVLAENAADELARLSGDSADRLESPPVALFERATLPALLRWRCLAQTESWTLLIPLGLDVAGHAGALGWLCELLSDPSSQGALGWLRARRLVTELTAEAEEQCADEVLLRIRLQPDAATPEAVFTELVAWFAGMAAISPAQLPVAQREALGRLAFAQGPQGDPVGWCRVLAQRLLRLPAEQVLPGRWTGQQPSLDEWLQLLRKVAEGSWLLAIADPLFDAPDHCPYTGTAYAIERLTLNRVADPSERPGVPSLPVLDSTAAAVPLTPGLPGLNRVHVASDQHPRVRIAWCFEGRPGLDRLHRLRLDWQLASEEVLYWLRLGGLDASWRVEGELLLLELGGAQPLVSEGLARVIGALARPLPSHMQRLAAQRWKTWQASQAQALPAYRLLERLERQMLCSDSGPECPETPAPSVVRMLWLDAGPQPALNLDALLIGPFPNLAHPVSWQPFRPPPREAGHTLIEVGCRHADQARLLYLQGLSDQPAERAFWQLLHRLIAAPFFDELRTRQQLGYWVVARYHSLVGHPGLLLLVQSPDQSQERIRQAMDEFLLREQRRLLDTDFARIAEQARVLAAGLRASALSADGRLEEAWQRCQGAAWPSRLPEADALEALTPEMWRKALDLFFLQAPRVALQSHQAD